MKTIVMTLSTSAEVKNIMRTRVLETLLSDPDIRLVCFVPHKKLEYYRKEFIRDRVIIQPVVDLEYGLSRARAFWRSLSYNSVPTETVRIRSNKQFFDQPSFFQFCALLWKKPVWVLGHLRAWRELVRWIEFRFFAEDIAVWKPLFEQYKPDLALATNPVHGTNIAFMKYARRCGVKLVGMMKTWDNLSSKGLLLVKPDRLIVPNRVVFKDALTLGDMLKERVFDGGCPQYDDYFKSEFEMTREEICAELKADPVKPVLLYCMGGIMNQDDPSEHLLMLDRAIEDGRLPPATIVLRSHPKYDVRALQLNQFKHVSFYQPGQKVSDMAGEWELNDRDIKILMNSVRHADVEYNTGSTMTLESAIYGQPIVLIGFDGYKNRPYYQSVRHGLDVTHYNIVQATGGVWRVDNEVELITATKGYLADQTIHADGRKRMVEELVGTVDGKAGERIGQFVLSQLA